MLGGLTHRGVEPAVSIAPVGSAIRLIAVRFIADYRALPLNRLQAVQRWALNHGLRGLSRGVLLSIGDRFLGDLRIAVNVGGIGGALHNRTAVWPLLLLDGLPDGRQWIALRIVFSDDSFGHFSG